jgi:serine/threonine protein kinase
MTVHKAGMVHGDMKPQNILLIAKDKDDVRLSDFGSAREV